MIRNRLATQLRDESGAVVVIVAIMMATLLLAGAFAVDLGNARQSARHGQNSADSAALAGAQQLLTTASTARQAAGNYAFQALRGQNAPVASACPASVPPNTICYDNGGLSVLVSNPWGPETPSDPTSQAPAQNQVHVEICGSVGTGLSQIIGISKISHCRTATAIAGVFEGQYACGLCVMNMSLPSAYSLEGGGGLTINGAALGINSDNPNAAWTQSNGPTTVNGSDIFARATGGYRANSGPPSNYYLCNPANGCPRSNAPEIPDPLASLTYPDPLTVPPMVGGGNETLKCANGNHTFSPGQYMLIDLQCKTATYTFTAGTYVIRKGLKNSGTLVANGVTFFFACKNYPSTPCDDPGSDASDCENYWDNGSPPNPPAFLKLGQAPSSTTITASASGPYKGLAIFVDRSNKCDLDFTGNNFKSITGTIYGLKSKLNWQGNGANSIFNSAIIVDTITVTGNGQATLNFDPSQNIVPMFAGVRLIS